MNDARRAFRLFLNGLPWAVIIGFLLGVLSFFSDGSRLPAWSNTSFPVTTAPSVTRNSSQNPNGTSTAETPTAGIPPVPTSVPPVKSASGSSVTLSTTAVPSMGSLASDSNGRCRELERKWWSLAAKTYEPNASEEAIAEADQAYWDWVEC